MSTATLDRTDTSGLDDFAPRCCLVWMVFQTKIQECENEAIWVGFSPCCGTAALVCDEHFQTRHIRPFQCKRCNHTHLDLIGWRRL